VAFCELDICLEVIQSQVRGERNHSDSVDSTLYLMCLGPNSILFFNYVVHFMAALEGHLRFCDTLEGGHTISWEGGINLIYREDSTH
jgi:hypothetical protein